MTEHIDHAAEARRILASYKKGGGLHIVAATAAQAHATLALVEQQRIANLIALARHNHTFSESFSEIANEALHGLIKYGRTPATPWSDPDDYPFVRPEIRTALGLDD